MTEVGQVETGPQDAISFNYSADEIDTDTFLALQSQMACQPVLHAAAALLDWMVMSRGLEAVKHSVASFLSEDAQQRAHETGISDSIAVESVLSEFNLPRAAAYVQRNLVDSKQQRETARQKGFPLSSAYSASGGFDVHSLDYTSSLPQAAASQSGTSPLQATAPSPSAQSLQFSAGRAPPAPRQALTQAPGRRAGAAVPNPLSPEMAPGSVLHTAAAGAAGADSHRGGAGTYPLRDTWGSASARSGGNPRQVGAGSSVGSARRQVSVGGAAHTRNKQQPRQRKQGSRREGKRPNKTDSVVDSQSVDGGVAAAADLLARSAWMLR